MSEFIHIKKGKDRVSNITFSCNNYNENRDLFLKYDNVAGYIIDNLTLIILTGIPYLNASDICRYQLKLDFNSSTDMDNWIGLHLKRESLYQLLSKKNELNS